MISATSFIVEKGGKANKTCEICNNEIKKKDIKITVRRSSRKLLYHHLQCYKPKLNQYIRQQDIAVHLEEEDEELFLN